MTPLEVYKELSLRVNKNDTNTNIDIPRGEAVLVFNSEAEKWLANQIERQQSTDNHEDISEMLEDDVELTKIDDKSSYSRFELPKDFFKRNTAYALASRGKCKDNPIMINFFKPKNKNVLITNSNESPSFEYQETLGSLSNNKLLIYKTDFDIDEAFLSYYRQPKKLDIKGYIKLDGTQSIDQETDFTDINIGYILDQCAVILNGRYANQEGFQIANAVKEK